MTLLAVMDLGVLQLLKSHFEVKPKASVLNSFSQQKESACSPNPGKGYHKRQGFMKKFLKSLQLMLGTKFTCGESQSHWKNVVGFLFFYSIRAITYFENCKVIFLTFICPKCKVHWLYTWLYLGCSHFLRK